MKYSRCFCFTTNTLQNYDIIGYYIIWNFVGYKDQFFLGLCDGKYHSKYGKYHENIFYLHLGKLVSLNQSRLWNSKDWEKSHSGKSDLRKRREQIRDISMSLCNYCLFISVYPFSVDLSVYPFKCPFIDLSIHSSISLPIYLWVNLSVYPTVCQFIHLSTNLSASSSVYPSVCLSLYLPINLSIYQSYQSVTSSIYLYSLVYLLLYLSVLVSVHSFKCLCLYFYFYQYVDLFVCPHLSYSFAYASFYLPTLVPVCLLECLTRCQKGLYSGVTQIDVSETARHYVEHGQIFLQSFQGLQLTELRHSKESQ